jgi:hypothetical protein
VVSELGNGSPRRRKQASSSTQNTLNVEYGRASARSPTSNGAKFFTDGGTNSFSVDVTEWLAKCLTFVWPHCVSIYVTQWLAKCPAFDRPHYISLDFTQWFAKCLAFDWPHCFSLDFTQWYSEWLAFFGSLWSPVCAPQLFAFVGSYCIPV